MKHFKLLIIPIFMIMFIVPVKALQELPDWAYTDQYYVVTEDIATGRLIVNLLSTKHNFQASKTGVFAPKTSFIKTLALEPGSDTWSSFSRVIVVNDWNGVRYERFYQYDQTVLKYSNFDIYVGGDLVFPETPVMNLAMAQNKSLENLGTEVQGASWKISAVGGVILGAVLVTHLVTRLRYWVTV